MSRSSCGRSVRPAAWVLLASFFLIPAGAGADELDVRLAGILQRADAEDPAARAAVADDLDLWCHAAGDQAPERLRKAAKDASPEVAGRIGDQLRFLEDLVETRAFLRMFEAFGMPDVSGRKWVRFNPGWATLSEGEAGRELKFHYDEGWLLEAGDKQVKFLRSAMAEVTIDLPAPLPESWAEFKDRHPKEEPLPGEWRERDFDAACRAILDPEWHDRMLAKDDEEGGWEFDRLTEGALRWEVEPALYAYWALQRGKLHVADRLVRAALAACTPAPREDQPAPTAEELAAEAREMVISVISTRLRWQAIWEADGGTDRAAILRHWEAIAAFPEHKGTPEALRCVRGYRSLIAEDAAWKEPVEAKGLAPWKQAELWMHRLRDQRANPREGEQDAAGELRKIGWPALGILIAHMDDDRPTRAMGCWRYYEQSSFGLAEIGGYARELFGQITGLDLADPMEGVWDPDKVTPPDEMRRRAEAWWAKAEAKGPEAHYVALLDRNLPAAAAKLLEMDAVKYAGTLLDRASRGGTVAAQILPVLKPHLGEAHREALAKLLDDASTETVLAAAEALWERCGDASGAPKLAAILHKADAANLLDRGLRYLAEADAETGAAVVRQVLARQGKPDSDMADYAAWFPDAALADALAAFLDDTSGTGCLIGSGGPCLLRDFAAAPLGEMTGFPKTWDWDMRSDARVAYVAEFKEWWAANRDKLDWKALRAAARERFLNAKRAR